jgi:hypothetical protein
VGATPSKYGPKLDLPGSYAPILGKNQGGFGKFFQYLWLPASRKVNLELLRVRESIGQDNLKHRAAVHTAARRQKAV